MSFQLTNQRTNQAETLTVRDVLAAIGNPVDDEVRLGEKVFTLSSFVDGTPGAGLLFGYHAYRPTAQVPLNLLQLANVPKLGFVQVFKNGTKLAPDQYYVDTVAGTVRLANNFANTLDPAVDVIDVHYSHTGIAAATVTGAVAPYNYGALNPNGTSGNTGNVGGNTGNTGNPGGGGLSPTP